MKHLRDRHNIDINGATQKRKLRNIGYYHGFKGFRYIRTSENKIKYTSFNEIIAVNQFDMSLKSLFYPQIMSIETALKNYILEEILNKSKSDSFNEIYNTLLLEYKKYKTGTSDYKKALKKRLDLRNKIYGALTEKYKSKPIVQHFYHQDKSVPIWAIFEIITLGDFGFFVSCLSNDIKKAISKSIKLNQTCDANGALIVGIIYTLKDLRNAVAHNDVIFDTRFKSSNIDENISRCLMFDTGIDNINFSSIIDYFSMLYIEKLMFL